MPVVGIPVKLLLERLATPIDHEDLIEHLQHLGCDVEGYATVRRWRCTRCDSVVEITETENPPVLCEHCGTDYKARPAAQQELGRDHVIRMELLAVRPDMFDPGGLARVLRNYLGELSEPARYALAPARVHVRVDPRLATEECPRPSIACAVVRDFTLTDDLVKVIMKLQENLHWAMGRDRKHASIGVYDLDRLHGTSFAYRTVGPDELRFTPLGLDPDRPEDCLTPRQILEQHPKGRAYARLLERFARYPLLCDETGQVLSMPPIINSEQTRVRRTTRNFFIDVTGSGERIVSVCLNVIVTSIAELDRRASLEQVEIVYPARRVTTPDLTPQRVELDPSLPARVIGVELTDDDLERHLRQMGHGISREGERDGDRGGEGEGDCERDRDGDREGDRERDRDREGERERGPGPGRRRGRLVVEVPAYRNDIMHPVDLAEDVAIAYGYHNIEPVLVPTMTVGRELPEEHDAELARRALTGLGFYETMTLILSSPELAYDALRLPRAEDCVLIDNPISVEQTMVRTSLVPGLLETFSINTSHELPQRIFEVGNVTRLDPDAETGARERRRVAAGAIGPRVDYAAIRSSCEALLRELGWRLEAEPCDAPCFIAGRGARVVATDGTRRVAVGQMGELHPEVLERFKLVHPVAAFEIELAGLRQD